MAEEQIATETKTEPVVTATPAESYEAPSFGELLKESQGGEVDPGDGPKPLEETSAPAVEPKLEAPAVTPPAPEIVPPPAVAAAPAAEVMTEEKRGLLAAISALRAEVRSLKQQEPSYAEETHAAPEPTQIESEIAQLKAANEETSRYYAKQLHPDFDDAYKVFEDEVKARAAEGDFTLYHQAKGAKLPYEAAYQTGKQLLVAKKYGQEALSNIDVLRSKIEAEVRDEAYRKGQADAEAKLTGIQRERDKQPTNIGTGRAGSGTSESEYRSPSMGELLSQVHKKGRANGYYRNSDN